MKAVLAVGASLLTLLVGCTSSSGGSRSASTPASSQPTPPAWTEQCLPQNEAYRLGSAPEFVGLTWAQAIGLADRNHVELLFIGGGGRCGALADGATIHPHPPTLVAIALDQEVDRNVTVASQINSDAKVVLAEQLDFRALR